MLFLRKRGFRLIVSSIVFTLVYSVTLPVSQAFQEEEVETSFLPEDFDEQLDELIIMLKEMDKEEIDLVNPAENNEQQIEELSPEVQELYLEYEEAVNSGEVEELEVTIENIQSEQDVIIETSSIDNKSSISFFGATANAGTKVTITNKTIQKLNDVTGWSGGIFAVATALIKLKLGLSPTPLTMLIIAVGALGMKGINSCNKNKKGIILEGVVYGSVTSPVGTVVCKPVK